MSQTSALPVRHITAWVSIWRDIEQPAHPGNMVADMLILIALTAASAADTGSRTRIEVRATATIQRGVILQNGIAVARNVEIAPIRQMPRDCGPADKTEAATSPDCRLIVYDLP